MKHRMQISDGSFDTVKNRPTTLYPGYPPGGVVQGRCTFVIRTGEGWQTLDELPRRHPDWTDGDEIWIMPAGSAAPVGAGGAATLHPHDPFITGPFPVIIHVPRSVGEDSRPYSNAQFALTRPHDELAIIVSSHSNLKVEGETVTGLLGDVGARLLLVREGQDHIKPLLAGGLFKFMVKDGVVVKYDLRLEGILLVDGKEIHVRQSSTTTVKDIGTTTLEVPEEARRKLGR